MLLELRHVDGRYGAIQAVRDISLSVRTGTSVALLGRNGAGKSTVLKLIAGMLPTAAGAVFWDGEDVSGLAAEDRVRRGIVLVPEGRGIFPALSVEDNLMAGALWERPNRRIVRERRERVLDLLPRLRALYRRAGGRLSGGEQQMLAIGRGLMSDPRILLIDEPSLGLAPMVVDAVYEVLGALVQENLGLVLVEQHVGLALGLCDQVIGLDKGQVVLAGTPSEVTDTEMLRHMYMGSEVTDEPVST
jgi:branched-chain amino acid transport system ATP-binding protein